MKCIGIQNRRTIISYFRYKGKCTIGENGLDLFINNYFLRIMNSERKLYLNVGGELLC